MARKDWKKHLLRVKQIADQNLGRVEKTEALTADLQVLEKKVELYQKVYYSTGKKLQACVQGQGHDAEKRMKKLPESQLAYSLTESSNLLTIDSLLGQIFQICGDAQGQVANKRLQQEMGIEKRVLAPIHQLLEVNIPAIQKHKKALQKMVLDMDSSKTRFQSAVKQQQAGNNAAKVDSLRDEYDEACYRVDQCRDQLATEMFTLASKEAELSQILLELIKCQADFHRKALDSLEKRIPQMEEQISFWTHMPVYGRPLDDHLRRTEREIALVIEECIKNLCTLGGLEEEGLFRIAGAANKVKKLKAAFDSEQCQDIAEEYDVHCIAGSLKQYLRELPDPLMDSSLYPNWMAAAHLPADQRLQALAEVITMLPEANYNNLRYLIKFLQKLTEFQELNKMSPSNIAIVMGPNLIWPQGEGGPSVLTTSTQSAIVEALISHCEYFFPGDDDIIDQIIQNTSPQPNLHSAPPPDLLNSVPPVSGDPDHHDYHSSPSTGQSVYRAPTPDMAHPSHTAQNLIGAIHFGNATSPTGSQENMAASTGSLQFIDQSPKNGGVSPKAPRRFNKKPAPLPPGERPSGPAPPPPVTADKHGVTPALPYPVKPPLPDRPVSNPEQPAAKPDRPPSPTRSRSTGGSLSGPPALEKPDKPEKPSKPDKPGERLYPNLPPTGPQPATQPKTRSSSSAEGSPQSQTRVEHSPNQNQKQSHGTETEKPPLPPPPVVKQESSAGEAVMGHKRTGSSGARPPRPTPPPPPPPAAKPGSVSEEGSQRLPSTGTDPNEQTYL